MNKQKIFKGVWHKVKNFKCRYCDNSGCSDGDYHDKKLIEKALEEALKLL